MRILKIILFLLATLILTTQAARHTYVRFIEPRSSVLDTFEDTDTKNLIVGAKTLSEIIEEYEPARKKVDKLEKEIKLELTTKTRDEYLMYEMKRKEDHRQIYDREAELKKAIQEWERRSKEILELRVFWFCGLVFFLAGSKILKKGKGWLGMAFLIPGVVEMIWWTSPSLRLGGSPMEFDRLLNNKLGFTVATLAILIVAWLLNKRHENQNSQQNL
jgi:hypothetical protein